MANSDINGEQELSAAIDDEAFKSAYIRMAMPKFKIEYSTKLNMIAYGFALFAKKSNS